MVDGFFLSAQRGPRRKFSGGPIADNEPVSANQSEFRRMTGLKSEARTALLPFCAPHERAQHLAIIAGIWADVGVEIHRSAWTATDPGVRVRRPGGSSGAGSSTRFKKADTTRL